MRSRTAQNLALTCTSWSDCSATEVKRPNKRCNSVLKSDTPVQRIGFYDSDSFWNHLSRSLFASSLRIFSAMAELRHDLLRQRWVIISDKRGKRPSDYKKVSRASQDAFDAGPCAFCPGHEAQNGHEVYAARDGEQADAPDWRVRVVENKYPAVSPGFDELLPSGEGTVYGACRLPGFGHHEVIVETPSHHLSLPELPVSHIAEVLKAYQARINYFQNDSRFKFCQVYKNRGNRAGASMSHSHSQLIALPVVSHNIQAELRGAWEYYDQHGQQCILCGVVYHETQVNRIRLIDENEHFITTSPYAPMFPYETWLIPKHHSSNFETVGDAEILSMAEMLKLTLRKLEVAFEHPPYNYTLQTAPLGKEHLNSAHFHWYLNILPHLASPGGFELGSGSYINPVIPEKAAEFLRNVDVQHV